MEMMKKISNKQNTYSKRIFKIRQLSRKTYQYLMFQKNEDLIDSVGSMK